jgi:hypothetical protein
MKSLISCNLPLILDKHSIFIMLCSKWISHCISYLRLHLQCDIDLRNPFSQNKSTIVYLYISWTFLLQVITVFIVFRLLTDFVCLYTYEFWLSLSKIVRSSVILLLPLFSTCILQLIYKLLDSEAATLWNVGSHTSVCGSFNSQL